MNKPNKLSNRTKRKIREQLSQERRSREETNRRAKLGTEHEWYSVPEEKESALELISGALAIMLAPVLYGMSVIIFGA